MCGRYLIESDMDEIASRYKINSYYKEYVPKEVFPSTENPIVINQGEKGIAFAKWHFPLFNGKQVINARSETIGIKPLFKNSFINKRCIIPASAFYEWKAVDRKKIKHRISISDRKIFSMAGIYNVFKDKSGNEFLGYVVITTEANKEMSKIHNRMPVILDIDMEEEWLDNKAQNLMRFLKPCEDSSMKVIENV